MSITSERRDWLLTGGWTLLIFVTIPLARGVQRLLERTDQRELPAYVTIVLVIAAVAVTLRYLRRLERATPGNYVWLALIGTAVIVYTVQLTRRHPEEAVHFVQYGVLSWLLFRALNHRIRDTSIFFAATLLATMAGTLDELIQWLTPERYWDLGDIGLNALAAALAQLALAKGVRPPTTSAPWRMASTLRLGGLALLTAVLLGISLLAVPDALAW